MKTNKTKLPARQIKNNPVDSSTGGATASVRTNQKSKGGLGVKEVAEKVDCPRVTDYKANGTGALKTKSGKGPRMIQKSSFDTWQANNSGTLRKRGRPSKAKSDVKATPVKGPKKKAGKKPAGSPKAAASQPRPGDGNTSSKKRGRSPKVKLGEGAAPTKAARIETKSNSEHLRAGDNGETVIIAQKHTATIPDDPDDPSGSSDLSHVKNKTGVNQNEGSLIDPSEAEHGPLLFIEKGKVQINTQAVAAKFAFDERIAFAFNQDALFQFVPEEGTWQKLREAVVVHKVGVYLKTIADERNAARLLAKRTPALANSILKFVKGNSPLGDSPAPEHHLVPVANGVLDLSGDTAKVLPHAPGFWFTSKISFAYNSQAKCPRFLEELIVPALSDPDDIDLLQRDLGRMLGAGNHAQRSSIVQGEGGSGKTVLVSILEGLLGWDHVAHLRTNQLTTRFETHAFQGKNLLVAKDVSPDFLQGRGAAMLKSLTGADRMETEQKFGGKFPIRGNFHVIITANSRTPISLEDDAEAWRRRILIYNFTRSTPAKRIPKFDQVLLEEEGEGILAWLVEGYMKHRRELENHGNFRLTAAQQDRINDLILESQGHVEFVRTRIGKSTGNLTVEEIHGEYVRACRERGWKPLAQQKFCTALPDLMIEHHNTHRRNDIVRNGAAFRGYSRVGFASEKTVGRTAIDERSQELESSPPPVVLVEAAA